MKKSTYILNRIMASMIMAFGFGFAARCLFANYDHLGDKLFFTLMMAAIGFVGVYLFRHAQQEYTESKEKN